MSLDRLADVELQLCMHGLQAKEILRLACCSRRLLQVADSAFAFKFALLRVGTTAAFASLPPTQSRLLRHIHVAVRWRSSASSPSAVDNLLTLCDHLPRLYSLDFSACDRLYLSQWEQLLAHPSVVSSLRSLRMHEASDGGCVSSKMLRLISLMPHLHTLSVLPSDFDTQGWNHLAAASSLTSLHIREASDSKAAAVRMSAAALCPKLTRLSVMWPRLYGDQFRSVLTLPGFQQLQSIRLARFYAAGSKAIGRGREPVSSSDYAAAFAALSSMHTLELCSVFDLNSLIPSLTFAPALRRLVIEPNSTSEWNRRSSPSISILSALLTSAPNLQCVISLHQMAWTVHLGPPDAGELKVTAKLRSVYGASRRLRSFGSRFQLESRVALPADRSNDAKKKSEIDTMNGSTLKGDNEVRGDTHASSSSDFSSSSSSSSSDSDSDTEELE